MLVLSRRTDESIVITLSGVNGEPITVTVLAVEGDRVKLGIQAPRQVTVLRQELCEAVREQNLAAARSGAAAQPQTIAALGRLWGGAPAVRPAESGTEPDQ